MATAIDQTFQTKFNNFLADANNNLYRSIKKVTPEQAGLSKEQVERLLAKIEKPVSKKTIKIESKNNLDDLTKTQSRTSLPSTPIYENGIHVLSHSETRELFRKVNKIRHENYIRERREKITKWYLIHRYSINTLFKESMNMFLDEDIEFLPSNKELYNSFVEYCYDDYMKYHI